MSETSVRPVEVALRARHSLPIRFQENQGKHMQLTIPVADDLIARVGQKLPPPQTGLLEAVALDDVMQSGNAVPACRPVAPWW